MPSVRPTPPYATRLQSPKLSLSRRSTRSGKRTGGLPHVSLTAIPRAKDRARTATHASPSSYTTIGLPARRRYENTLSVTRTTPGSPIQTRSRLPSNCRITHGALPGAEREECNSIRQSPFLPIAVAHNSFALPIERETSPATRSTLLLAEHTARQSTSSTSSQHGTHTTHVEISSALRRLRNCSSGISGVFSSQPHSPTPLTTENPHRKFHRHNRFWRPAHPFGATRPLLLSLPA